MDPSNAERSAAYYDARASKYDADVTAKPGDILARAAFRDLVARHVANESTILDFGCGSGLDACWYANRGYRVLAYDNSPVMVRRLEDRAAAEITNGRIASSSAAYSAFFDVLARWPRPNAVVADFAVLNMIPDPAPLFSAFADRLASPGWLIVSVLNPWHWSRLAAPRWWRGLARSLLQKSPNRLSDESPTFLHFTRLLLRTAPRFHLIGRAFAGRFVRYDAATPGDQQMFWGESRSVRDQAMRIAWRTPLASALGTFSIFVMRRDP